MKTCFKCQVNKSVSDFYKNKARKDGLQTICKQCVRSYDSYLNGKKRYEQSTKGKECNRRGVAKYKKTVGGKIANKRYQQSVQGRLYDANQKRMRRDVNARLSVEEVIALYAKFCHMCFNCQAKNDLCIDHHYPLARGFALTVQNAVVLCKKCNSAKCDKLPVEFYNSEQLHKLEQINVSAS